MLVADEVEYGALVEQRKPEVLGQELVSLAYFVHHKSHMGWPGTEPRLPRGEGGDKQPEPRHRPPALIKNSGNVSNQDI
jgi:hypothetical protein